VSYKGTLRLTTIKTNKNMKLTLKELVVLSMMLFTLATQAQVKKIAFIGQGATYTDNISAAEFPYDDDRAAATWFMDDFGVNTPNVTVNYFSFEDIAGGANISLFDAVWIQSDGATFDGRLKDWPRSTPEGDGTKHSMIKESGFAWTRDETTDTPLENAFIAAIKTYYEAGGNMLLGNFAGAGVEVFGVINPALTDPWEYRPNQSFGNVNVNTGDTNSVWGNWWNGASDSPLISGITTSVDACNVTLPYIEFLSSGTEKKNRVLQYNLDFGRVANDNPGADLATKRGVLEDLLQAKILIENCGGNEVQGLQFNPAGFNAGKGTVISYGAGTFDWYVGTGGNNDNVKKLTKNTLLYLAEKSSLSIASFNELLDIRFYPNPVQTELQIQYNGDLTTSVYDISGVKLIETKSKTIDMSKMTTGTYIIKALDNETKKANSCKIIKK
jgi:hypothetical protein